MVPTALKYHPDRNLGREAEFKAKFQAIQSAHDVLVDPQLRIKYDADRIRAGLLHTYTAPKPNVPPRSPNTASFPTPPRRPPPPTAKSNYPPPPSASRYTNFGRETGSSWANPPAEDAKTKTDDFKAWEQMRHGQGSVPLGRSVPPKYPGKASTFSQPREAGGNLPKDSPSKRPTWAPFEDIHPGIARSKTTRVPKKTGFAPGTPGGDEPQARATSAYFNVSRGERPTPSRSHAPFPPPPPRPNTTPKKPDPLYPFKTHAGQQNPFAKGARVSTPYATAGGEKTYFSSQGLGRSTSWREGGHSSEWYDSETNETEGIRHGEKSTASDRNRSASPKTAGPKQPRPVSSSSSSDSSSDESVQMKSENDFYKSPRQPNGTRRSRTSDVSNGHRMPSSKPSAKFDDVKDQHRATSNPRQQHPDDQHAHRMSREAENHRQQFLHTDTTRPYSTSPAAPQRPLHRPRSWHQNNGSTDGMNNIGKEQNGGPPMYDTPEKISPVSSSSSKWSDQWPFMSPKKPRLSTVAPPPYWAIPSSLSPRKQAEVHRSSTTLFSLSQSGPHTILKPANDALSHSFTFPKGDAQKFTKHPPPLRSHSSETINMNFSPSEWNGKFTGNEHFAPPLPNRTSATKGRFSPTGNRPLNNKEARSQHNPTNQIHDHHPTDANVSPTKADRAPSLPAESDYSTEEWAKHFKPATFAYPPPPSSSPARGPNRKRPKTPSRFPKTAYKRPAVTKDFGESAFADDAGDELDTGSIAESLSGQTSAGESPMDIDRNLTPPSAGQPKVNGTSPQPDPTETTPRPPAPPIPPRPDGNATTADPHMNLCDLKNVEPFAPSQDGLKNLNELNSTLPFESRPSNSISSRPTPQTLVPPNPPKAPSIPEKLTQPAQERYMAQMAVYMFEWNNYNTKMLDHFNERQSSVGNMLKPGWMNTRGDCFEKYLQGVEEDFRVREHWELSWEKHRECMKCLGTIRAKLLSA